MYNLQMFLQSIYFQEIIYTNSDCVEVNKPIGNCFTRLVRLDNIGERGDLLFHYNV